MDCIVVGDSIANQYLAISRECRRCAYGGINSHQLNQQTCAQQLTASTIVISIGSNDLPSINTEHELNKLRSRMTAKRVYWIMPAIKPRIRTIVSKIAGAHGDVVVEIQRTLDGVHPDLNSLRAIRETVTRGK